MRATRPVTTSGLHSLSGLRHPLLLEPAHGVERRGYAAVRAFLFHHPLQPGFALRVQHFTGGRVVGDGDVVFLILDTRQLLRVAVAVLSPARAGTVNGFPVSACVTVRHHPAPVFIIVSKAAHLCIAAIHCRQFAARRPAQRNQRCR